MTEVLKGEMDRVLASRRAAMVVRLADYARQQAAFARVRAEGWATVLPSLTTDGTALDASREVVAAIARKAEQKARAASAARAGGGAKAAGSGGASVMSAPGGGGDGGNTLFGDAAPIPMAADL